MKIVPLNEIPTVQQLEKRLLKDLPAEEQVKVYETCIEMKSICRQESGIGLSAVQIGVPWRLFAVLGDGTCAHIPQDEFAFFADCTYSAVGEQQITSVEGCLSLKTPVGDFRRFRVQRPFLVEVTGWRIHLRQMEYEPIAMNLRIDQQGIVFAHEIDHQLGVLISEIGEEVFVW